jgi:hypothetical protein
VQTLVFSIFALNVPSLSANARQTNQMPSTVLTAVARYAVLETIARYACMQNFGHAEVLADKNRACCVGKGLCKYTAVAVYNLDECLWQFKFRYILSISNATSGAGLATTRNSLASIVLKASAPSRIREQCG